MSRRPNHLPKVLRDRVRIIMIIIFHFHHLWYHHYHQLTISYRFTPDGTALQSVYEAFRFTESYGVKSFYIIIVKIVSTAKILDYCHISDISYMLCDKCYDWPWSLSYSVWKQSNRVKYLMISNLTCNNFDPLGDIPVQCQVLPWSLWTGNFNSVLIYIYHLHIFFGIHISLLFRLGKGYV